jgi:hypothetical protein
MFRFYIRDLLWLTALVAIGAAWVQDSSALKQQINRANHDAWNERHQRAVQKTLWTDKLRSKDLELQSLKASIAAEFWKARNDGLKSANSRGMHAAGSRRQVSNQDAAAFTR